MNETAPTLFAVAMGGALGAMLRFRFRFLTQKLKYSASSFVPNIIASFLLGFVTALFADAFFAVQSWQAWFYPFLAIGVAGSLSTFSALALEMHENTKKLGWQKSVGYAVIVLLSGLTALFLGLYLGTSVPT
jgi:CrcB protein